MPRTGSRALQNSERRSGVSATLRTPRAQSARSHRKAKMVEQWVWLWRTPFDGNDLASLSAKSARCGREILRAVYAVATPEAPSVERASGRFRAPAEEFHGRCAGWRS